MPRVAIVHHSQTGYTRLMADAVAEGVLQHDGAKVERFEVVGADIVEGRYGDESVLAALDACDAVIFGSPTHMGSISAPMKAFLDASIHRWYQRAWSGKVAAAFTVSGTPSGDKLNTLLDLFTCAMQHGMIWVPLDETPINREGINRLGVFIGAAAQPDLAARPPALVQGDLETGRRLGANVARVTAALVAGRG